MSFKLMLARAALAGLILLPAIAHAQPVLPEPNTLPPGYITRAHMTPALGAAPGMKVTLFTPSPGLKVWKINLTVGDDLMTAMNIFMKTHAIKQATLTGIGGFSTAQLAWYDPKVGAFKLINADAKAEVSSFVGTISTDNKGEETFHAHVALTQTDGSTKSGHLVSATINPVMEIYVTDLGEGRAEK